LRTAVSADAVPEMRVPGTRVFRYSGEGPFKESCRRIHIVIANLEKAFNNATGALRIVAMRRHAPSAGKPATAPEDAGSTDVPEHIVESGLQAGGIGEAVLPPVAPAVANAVSPRTGSDCRACFLT
jgi:hypothetical protein